VFASPLSTGTLYVRYLVQRQNASEGGLTFDIYGGPNPFFERLSFGQFGADANPDTDGKFAVRIVNPPQNPIVSNVAMKTGVTQLVVLRFDLDMGLARLRAYIDPESLTDESSSTVDLDQSGLFVSSIAGVGFTARGFQDVSSGGPPGVDGVDYFSAASGVFDELVIGTSYADVVPEPGGIAALAAGAALLVLRYRRVPRGQ
jgi:hypothetical protein